MTRMACALLLVALSVQPIHAAPMRGLAAQHRTLARVAQKRGMDSSGVLFASPIAPLGSRLCVSSQRAPEPTCGRVVDICQPEHCAWQVRTGRIIEVDPAVARRLCRDASGPPRDCPIKLWRE